MARITKKIVFLCVFFYQNMGKSISLCTMAVNEGPGIRARGSSSRASWHDFPTFHGDHHEVEHQEELDNDVMRWSRMTRNPPEHLRMISPPLDINNYNNNNKGPFTYYVITSVMNFGKKLQYDFPKMRGRGGSKAVWNVSENSSVLGTASAPISLILFIG